MTSLTAKATLGRKKSRLRVSGSRQVAMGTDIFGAVLMIVTQLMTLKVFSDGRGRLKDNRMLNDVRRRGYNPSSVR